MKDTETVTLDDRIKQQLYRAYTKGAIEKEKEIESEGRLIHRPLDSILYEELQGIIKLFEQIVERAKPLAEDWGNSADDTSFNTAVNHYEQNLKQALSNSGKAGDDV